MDEGLARVREIVELALDAPARMRESVLADACAGDDALRAEVESLLHHADAAGAFLEDTVLQAEAIVSPGTTPEQVVGRRVGPYRLTGVIGSGGMGTVYRAERADDEYRKQVAIKFVRSGRTAVRAAARFRAERQLLADLEHPGVARLLDGGTTEEGWPYFVMDHIDGAPLDRFCAERRLTIRERLELFLEVCNAVAYAHGRLVVHCDLKPGNILVTREGAPRLVDFGIARLLAKSVEEGASLAGAMPPLGMTPPYSSPELVAGDPVSTSADVYSLGVILSELLGGEGPEAPRALRGDLASIVRCAVSTDPAARYGSVEQLADDVRRHLQHRPVGARRQTLGYRAGRLLRRRAGAASLAAALALALCAGTVVSSVGFAREAAARRRADTEAARAVRIGAFLGDTLAWSDPFLGLRGDPTLGDLLDHAVARIEREPGDDPEVEAVLRTTIGVAYQNFGVLADAEPQLRRALALRRAAHGDVHLGVAESHHRLGRMLDIKGARSEAEREYRSALDIRLALLGDEDRLVADVLHDLAGVLRRDPERADESERVLLHALEIRRKLLDRRDPALADSLESLGNLRVRQGDFAEGERLLLEALAIRREALPDGDPKIAQTYHNLAHLAMRANDLDAAEAHLAQSIEMGRRVHGDDDPSLLNPMLSMAAVAAETGRPELAERLLHDAVDIGAVSLPPDHYMVLLCRQRYGRLLVRAGRLEEAEPHLVAVYEGLRVTLGGEHAQVRAELERLVRLYERMGRADVAERYRAQLSPPNR
jgi:serine/threonine-protein kinase